MFKILLDRSEVILMLRHTKYYTGPILKRRLEKSGCRGESWLMSPGNYAAIISLVLECKIGSS